MLKFLYITQDPFTNNSAEFVRILAISYFPSLGAMGNPAGESVSTGILSDPEGFPVASLRIAEGQMFNSSTANPYSFSASFQGREIIIIPPGWSFRNFGRAVAIQGSLEEVLKVS